MGGMESEWRDDSPVDKNRRGQMLTYRYVQLGKRRTSVRRQARELEAADVDQDGGWECDGSGGAR
jgi:hypothetical protein